MTRFRVCAAIVFLVVSFPALAASPGPTTPPQMINENQRVIAKDSVHQLARPEFDRGPAARDLTMQKMVLVLRLRPEAERERDALLAQLSDPSSPYYHQWLTPEEYGLRFGVTDQDLDLILQWLRSYGLAIDEVAKGRGWVNFSGTVDQVNEIFRTEIHEFQVNGQIHHANALPPSIPVSLSGVVVGPLSLHDFYKKPLHRAIEAISPLFTYGSAHYLAPADFATIYNVDPAYSAGYDGTGTSVAIVARTDITLSDVQSFRNYFGLPANNPVFIHNGPSPGNLGGNEEGEACLDVQWAGAVAKSATIKMVISASTYTTDGMDLSAQYIVNNNAAPVMSTSFGLCEQQLGADNTFYNNLWAQAAAQGISSFVASGDSGAAGCDLASSSSATHGLGVNGLASTPYNIAVGGTQFMDVSSPGTYWSSSNNPTTKASVLSYIPEQVWNESGSQSGGSGLWATGGGASTIYAKPAWQVAPGVPGDGKRDVPDVSLSGSGHDGYLMFQGGSLYAIGGTSASSPAFAGIMALVVDATGQSQGNANTKLYALGVSQYGSGGSTVFHDVDVLNNSVPGQAGYSAGTGYDMATGLGSVDVTALINNWASQGASFTVGAAPNSLSVARGSFGTSTITTAVTGGFNSAITLSATGAPSGATVSFGLNPIPVPGSGSSTMTVTVGAATALGIYPITVTATGGGITRNTTVNLTVTAGSDFAISGSPASFSVQQTLSGTSTLSIAVSGGFNSAITLSAAGVPSGATVGFSVNPVPAPGSGSSIVTFDVTQATKLATYPITVTATGGGITKTITLTLTVLTAPKFTLTVSTSTLSVAQGSTGNVTVSTTAGSGFSEPLSLSVSGVPAGTTASFGTNPIPAPGSGSSILTFNVGSSTVPGTYPITVTAVGGIRTRTATVNLTITAVPSFAIFASPNSLSVARGSSRTSTITTAVTGGFSSAITLSATGAPSGATLAFSVNPIPAPGSGNSIMTVTVGAATAIGTYPITVTATGGGITKNTTVNLTVTGAPDFVISVSPASLSVQQTLSGTSTLSIAVSGGFNSAISLSAAGVPSGTTVGFSVNPVPAPGSGSSIVTFDVTQATKLATYPITVTATGGGITRTTTLTLTVVTAPKFTLTVSTSTLSVAQGGAGNVTVSTTAGSGFSEPLSLSVSGVPAGTTASFGTNPIPAPGTGSSILTFNVGTPTVPGTYPITVTAVGSIRTRTATVNLTITALP